MIDEIRIMSKTGANIFSGKVDLDSSEVQMAESDVLFAGFISAILSVSEELQNSDIRELGYQENKIIFTLTENLIFLGFVDSRVPNDEILVLLDDIIARWMAKYDDQEYPFVPDEMRSDILQLVQASIKDVFWWASPNFNLENNMKLVKNTFQKPSGSYYIQYLPRIFLLTGLLFMLLAVGVSAVLNIAFTGFASGNPTQGIRGAVLLTTSTTVLLFTFGTATLMKIMYRGQFNVYSFLVISGIYSLVLAFLFFFTSNLYFANVYLPALDAVKQSILLTYTVDLFLFRAPFNIAYFGFVVLTSYTTSFNNQISTAQYITSYLFALLFVMAVSTFIGQGLLGVVPS